MKILFSKKGYTLVELLAVIAILTIIASLTFSVFIQLNRVSNGRVDQSRITIYNKAFEDFRFTDYSTLQATPDERVVIVEGGKVKINQYLNLTGEDIEALSLSGKGSYPKTKRECIAAIRAYCGTNDILPVPAAGVSYSYFYYIPDGKCYLKATADVDTSDINWINLSEYYILINNYKLGDVNNDKVINETDATIIQSFVNNTYSFTDHYLYLCADIDSNGKIEANDYTLLYELVSTNQVHKLKWSVKGVSE